MRVAITGSAGTGKTTAAKALAARGEVVFVADGLRRRIEDGLVLGRLDRAQLKDLFEELYDEHQAELALAGRMRGGAVSDRCCLDFLVLWLYHGLGDDDTRTAGLAHRAFRDLAEYDAVVLMPWGVLPLVDDGVRAANPWTQLHFHALFEGMARDHIEGRRLLRLPRDILDAAARVDWIHARVNGDR
ncbi:MAG: AAA family ATPase [Thalassobaculaceae bacterium]